jgi:hypothetical protein
LRTEQPCLYGDESRRLVAAALEGARALVGASRTGPVRDVRLDGVSGRRSVLRDRGKIYSDPRRFKVTSAFIFASVAESDWELPVGAVERISRLQWNNGFRPDSSPSRDDSCRPASRPLLPFQIGPMNGREARESQQPTLREARCERVRSTHLSLCDRHSLRSSGFVQSAACFPSKGLRRHRPRSRPSHRSAPGR